MADKENEYAESDSDSDGYAHGTVQYDDDDNESDDLFLTPRKPSRVRGSPSAASAADEYATFDPILALLDDHWAVLGLGDAEEGAEEAYDDEAPHLVEVTEEMRTMLFDTSTDGHCREERELMEALRDADALEASRERIAAECEMLRTEAKTRVLKTRRLERENEAAALEIAALNEAMATLTAAHDVDARINALLIDDQAEEIRDLRAKMASREMRRVGSGHPPSATSSITGELTDSDGESTPFGKGMKEACRKAARTKRGGTRAKERAQLVERKASLFKEYEKRHSMTIQHVVRRSSQRIRRSDHKIDDDDGSSVSP